MKITGNPDERHISTSFVERQNLTMRMSMRRFTRLTNAFSKELENHKASVAFYFMWYNFARIHQTLLILTVRHSAYCNDVIACQDPNRKTSVPIFSGGSGGGH